MERRLIAHCDQCEKQIIATEVAHLIHSEGPAAPDWRFSLLQCTDCGNPMLVYEENFPDGFNEPIWLHPAPPPAVSPVVPISIRRELEEARSCLSHGLLTAAAVMAGRAVEGIAQAYGIHETTLHKALQELGNRKVLDGRFLEWADHLRTVRNEAAHFTGSSVTGEDATDMVALAEAIATYLFVFTRQFDEFMQRRK